MKALFIAMVFMIFFCKNAIATNLRGQIIRYNPSYGQNFPLPGVRVDLYIRNGNQWIDLSYAITGNDGSYFFYNVQPGATFQIVIFGNFKLSQPMGVQAINPPYFENIPVISA
jgi:hypothetical protein